MKKVLFLSIFTFMKKRTNITLCAVSIAMAMFCFLPCTMSAQTLQGTVVDAISSEPLVGATVQIVGLQKGAVVDVKGDYIIHDIPIGRYTIECRMMGFETQQQVEVQINSHHATVVDFKLMVMPKMLEGVTITAQVNKARALNPTAVAGTKMISVEEAKRYGGAFDDIARVVKHNVGTTGSEDNTSLSIHGNPAYVTVFHIDGVEMPSPNHFDGTGDFGTGKISALHTDLLAKQRFLHRRACGRDWKLVRRCDGPEPSLRQQERVRTQCSFINVGIRFDKRGSDKPG